MTDDVLHFLQMIFGKGKNIFSEAGFFSLTRGINERDIAARYLKTLDRSFHRRFKEFSLRFTIIFCLVDLNQPKTYPGSQRLFMRGLWFRVSLVAWVFGRRSIGLRREKKTPFILRVPEEN